MAPSVTPLSIEQRVEYRRDFRFKSGAAYADLTGYQAQAEIWNEERTIKYGTFNTVWLHRTITNTSLDGDYHLRIVLPASQTLTLYEDAYWDLLLVPPNTTVQPPFYSNRGKVTYILSFTEPV